MSEVKEYGWGINLGQFVPSREFLEDSRYGYGNTIRLELERFLKDKAYGTGDYPTIRTPAHTRSVASEKYGSEGTGNGWHFDGGYGPYGPLRTNFLAWSNGTPTPILYRGKLVKGIKPNDVVIVRNLKALHSSPPPHAVGENRFFIRIFGISQSGVPLWLGDADKSRAWRLQVPKRLAKVNAKYRHLYDSIQMVGD